jgi:hypothetical protein
MARQPFFGQTPGIQSRGMNMQVATQGARDMAQGMSNFGQAVGGMMQKFKAKKEKEAMEGKAEQALLSMGLPPEVAKAGSKDKGLISSFMQNEQIKLGQDRNEAYKAGIKAKTDADTMQKKVDMVEAEELSAKRFFVNGDERDQTQAEKTYGNLAGFVDTDHENQPFGYYTHALKQVQGIHGDKETRSALDNFTGNVDDLMSGDPEASASWVRNGGKASDLVNFMQIGDLRKARKAEQEKVAKPFQPGAPVPVDLDGSGTPNYFGLRTTENSMQYVDASGTDQRIPTSIVENKDIQKMIAEGDVDGLTIAFRNQIRTEEDEELRDVSKLPSILQALIEKAKQNQP